MPKLNPFFFLPGVIVLACVVVILVKVNWGKPEVTPPPPPAAKTTVSTDGKVKYSEDYTFVLLGDSMTAALGNSDELKSYLSKYYPSKTFEFLNYGFGSSNILSVEKRLTENTEYGRVFQPILNIDFDIILVESFGYNPLSQYPLEEGLKIQNQTLDKIVTLIKNSNPRSPIVFVATIAPSSKKYGEGEVDLSPQKRAEWAAERTAYIKNHITYAQSHNIPIINIYEKSLKDGDGNLELIDNTNYIHPSPSGVIFISHEIADFLYQNKILDQIKKN